MKTRILSNLLLIAAVFLCFSFSAFAETKLSTDTAATIEHIQIDVAPLAATASAGLSDSVGVKADFRDGFSVNKFIETPTPTILDKPDKTQNFDAAARRFVKRE